MHEALLQRIQAVAGDARVVWGWLDARDTEFPRITLTDLGSRPAYSLDGRIGSERHGVQVDVWHHTQEDALALGRAIVAALPQMVGVVAGVNIKRVFSDGETLSSEMPKDRDYHIGRYHVDLRLRWVAV
jgi:Protein of unknown function (DUF3168)